MFKKKAALKNLLKIAYPLYDEDFPLIIFWSPRGGCTSLIKWFYFQVGVLQDAKNYNPWIHYYRMNIFEKQPNYVNRLSKCILEEKKESVKLVRNPYKRCVSSFFATLTNKIIMEQIAPNSKGGLSFKEFLYLVRQKGVKRGRINNHVAQQYEEGEKMIIRNYFKLEEFEKAIINFETKYKLTKSPLSEIIKSPHHMSSKMINNNGVNANTIITLNMFSGSLPTYESFYDNETKELVKDLFIKDFQAYGYDQSKI
jgi:Sulfotransferase family